MHVVTQRSPTNSLKSCLGLDAFTPSQGKGKKKKKSIINKYY